MIKPRCPVTGEPAARFVQWVDARFLARLWKMQMRADPRPSFGGVERFGLWVSPTGLHFFDPPVEGDDAFYEAFYLFLLRRKLWRKDSRRGEFAEVAKRVRPGERVLDVGCGFGPFRHAIPQARYTGLDPHFARHNEAGDIRNELLRDHLADHAGTYDVVCAFQVIEHLREPLPLFADMVRAARPGGLVIVTAPHVPSAMTRLPNSLMNAPPHHLTWWTRAAFAALAERSGAEVEAIETVPWDEADSLMYWMERCSFVRCRTTFYRNRLSWHLASLAGYLPAVLLNRLRGVPATRDEGASLMLVARRA